MEDERVEGRLLISSPALRDPNFDHTIVLVLDHDDHGALGVILNRPSDLPVAHVLPGWESYVAPPGLVFEGGPVADGVAIGLARRLTGGTDLAAGGRGDGEGGEGSPPGWTPVLDDLGLIDLSMDPLEVTPLQSLRIFSGYAGWSPGQLEGELALGAWFVVEAVGADVLGPRPDQLWSRVLRRQPGDLSKLALYPADPSMN